MDLSAGNRLAYTMRSGKTRVSLCITPLGIIMPRDMPNLLNPVDPINGQKSGKTERECVHAAA